MEKIFNNILLPVDLSKRTDADIEKAIEFANRLNCSLHVLHILNEPFLPFLKELRLAEKKYGIQKLQEKYSGRLKRGLNLYTELHSGNSEKKILDYSIRKNIDLVFVHEERFSLLSHNQLSVKGLAGKLNCPVLSIKSPPFFQEHQIIVLPIGTTLPLNKIRVVIYLAKNFNASIHLIALESNKDQFAYLQKAYQVIKDNTDLEVQCSLLRGQRLGDIAVQYAYSVNAGLIVVNPGEESLLSGFINRVFSRFIVDESRVPVMTVV